MSFSGFVICVFLYDSFELRFKKNNNIMQTTRCISGLALLTEAEKNSYRDARNPVFGVSDKVRFKPACSATDTTMLARKCSFAHSNPSYYKFQ